MRCADCRGEIEKQSSFCPHCGAKLNGAEGRRSSPDPMPAREAFSEAASDLMRTGRRLANNDMARKVGAGAAIGAIAGAVVPVLSIGLGALVGGGIVAWQQWKKR